MDHKLKSIENLIIADTAKYYENHDGESGERSSMFRFLFEFLIKN